MLFGPDFVAAVRRRTSRRIDVHLMVSDADAWVPRFIEVGADMVTVHRRSMPGLVATLGSIRSAGAVPSLAVEVCEPVPPGAEVRPLDPAAPGNAAATGRARE